ncbi:hypothetical protein EDD86DRAFT_213314 [Gorgonomyces haynaldii]|nr:hypothetical protein EDD86DRAFT_213314 [Gorgonomyces haynaldii]
MLQIQSPVEAVVIGCISFTVSLLAEYIKNRQEKFEDRLKQQAYQNKQGEYHLPVFQLQLQRTLFYLVAQVLRVGTMILFMTLNVVIVPSLLLGLAIGFYLFNPIGAQDSPC